MLDGRAVPPRRGGARLYLTNGVSREAMRVPGGRETPGTMDQVYNQTESEEVEELRVALEMRVGDGRVRRVRRGRVRRGRAVDACRARLRVRDDERRGVREGLGKRRVAGGRGPRRLGPVAVRSHVFPSLLCV